MDVSKPDALIGWLACLVLGSAGLCAGGPLNAQSGSELAAFLSPQEGGPRRWVVMTQTVDLRDRPAPDALSIGAFQKGDVLSNLACQQVDDLVWCKVRSFLGGVKGFVPASALQPATGPDGVVPYGENDGKQRARKGNFDATAEVPCAQEQGQSLGKCSASVVRAGGGDATVVARFSNGFKRQLYFVHGAFIRASATMSGVGTDTDWRVENQVYLIRVDDQRYELPSAFLFGK